MTKKSYPVLFEPRSFEKLTELAGEHLSEIEKAIQMLLSRRPRHGVPFGNDLRAIALSPPRGRIVIVYQFDEESVFIVKVMGTPLQ